MQIKHTPQCVFLHAAWRIRPPLCLVGRMRALLMWNSRSELHVETPGLTTEREVPPNFLSSSCSPLLRHLFSSPVSFFSKTPTLTRPFFKFMARPLQTAFCFSLANDCISSALEVATRTKVGFRAKIVGTGSDKLAPSFKMLLRICFILSFPCSFSFHDSAFEYRMNQALLVIPG